MKLFTLILFSLLLAGCEESYDRRTVITQNHSDADYTATSTFSGYSKTYIEALVSIDSERNEIEIVEGQSSRLKSNDGKEKELCGVTFQKGDILTYQFIDSNQIELQLPEETIVLKRVHSNEEDITSIRGDWRLVDDTLPSSGRNLNFYFRSEGHLYIDLECFSF